MNTIMAVSDIAPIPLFRTDATVPVVFGTCRLPSILHFGNSDGPPTQSAVAVAHFPAQTADRIPIIAIAVFVCFCGAADAAAVDCDVAVLQRRIPRCDFGRNCFGLFREERGDGCDLPTDLRQQLFGHYFGRAVCPLCGVGFHFGDGVGEFDADLLFCEEVAAQLADFLGEFLGGFRADVEQAELHSLLFCLEGGETGVGLVEEAVGGGLSFGQLPSDFLPYLADFGSELSLPMFDGLFAVGQRSVVQHFLGGGDEPAQVCGGVASVRGEAFGAEQFGAAAAVEADIIELLHFFAVDGAQQRNRLHFIYTITTQTPRI
jgi:hypothetical protein